MTVLVLVFCYFGSLASIIGLAKVVKKGDEVIFWTLPLGSGSWHLSFFDAFEPQSFLKRFRAAEVKPVPVQDSSALRQLLRTLLGVFFEVTNVWYHPHLQQRTSVDGPRPRSDPCFVEALQHFLFVYC